ncbi:hypothetical protein [Flavobacterium sp.]|uniref:hypothetical protein n=1 Tax=Flavobacterium sp. TaxID=239 RepID=UPI0037517DB0
MKSTEFFIAKAESFLEELNKLELIPYYSDGLTNDIYKEPVKANDSNFTSQTKELDEIRFQMNLMFSEFDNGELFRKKLNGYKTSSWFDNTPYLNHLVNINDLFIDFLNEYRVE